MRSLVILATTVVIVFPIAAEAGGAGRFLTGLLARGVLRAATVGHRTNNWAPPPTNWAPPPKVYNADTLTVEQLATCLKKATELDRESEKIEAKKPAIEAKKSELRRFTTALEARRTYLNHTNQVEVDQFNESVERYKQRGEILKLELQAYNAAADAQNLKANLYDASCAKKYYAEDMYEAKKLAEADATH